MVGFAILSLAAFRPANADEEKQRTEKLEDIVVTATRTEKDISESPASVSVVTQADIEKRDIRSVDEALNTIPGVYSQRYVQGGMLSSLTTINLRGISGGNRTLVMEDGFTMNEPYSGSQKRMLSIEPENIERIEVVKGPFSSLYGGYAMGGVVNIITKMPEKREFTVKTGYGSSSTRGESLDDLKRFYASYGDKLFNKLSVLFITGIRKPADIRWMRAFLPQNRPVRLPAGPRRPTLRVRPGISSGMPAT
jgi:iron complex outermembrane receptor protein